jgi:hypothetical protein
MKMSAYDSLLGHLKHHEVKDWLLRGCKEEDARTIREAVENTPTRRIRRALARVLTDGRRSK